MTPQMHTFLRDLADLMEKHEIDSFDIRESGGYQPCPEAIEVCMMGKWDEDGEVVREFCEVDLPTCFDAESLKTILSLL